MTPTPDTTPNAQPAVPFYDVTYGGFARDVYQRIRRGTWGDDIGQNGWITATEQDRFIEWLAIDGRHHLLDVACGSGGPTLRIAERTGAAVTGIDVHPNGISAARRHAAERNLSARATFVVHDAAHTLDLADGSADAVVCIDAINHLPQRSRVLAEWWRVLRPGGVLLFTDPIVVTGPLTSQEIATRASIGYFQFVPESTNLRLLANAGFRVQACEDLTRAVADVAGRWRAQRELYSPDLLPIEGEETFNGQQRFLEVAALVAAEGRLSRFAYFARKAD